MPVNVRPKRQFKYYAIRIANMVIFRRTVNKIIKVKSVLYNPRNDFRLEQVSYSGGVVVGCMPYNDWRRHSGLALNIGQCKSLERSLYRALDPYICKQ